MRPLGFLGHAGLEDDNADRAFDRASQVDPWSSWTAASRGRKVDLDWASGLPKRIEDGFIDSIPRRGLVFRLSLLFVDLGASSLREKRCRTLDELAEIVRDSTDLGAPFGSFWICCSLLPD